MDKLLTMLPTSCLIFDSFLQPDTKPAEVRDKLLSPSEYAQALQPEVGSVTLPGFMTVL